MNRIAWTEKGLDFKREVKAEEREYNYKMQMLSQGKFKNDPHNYSSGYNELKTLTLSRKKLGETLFYLNNCKHKRNERKKFWKDEFNNHLRGVFRSLNEKRNEDFVKEKYGCFIGNYQELDEYKKKFTDEFSVYDPKSIQSKDVLLQSVRTFDPTITSPDNIFKTLSNHIPPQVSSNNKLPTKKGITRLDHLTQTQLSYNLKPLILNIENQNTNERMEKKRYKYMKDTFQNFEKVKEVVNVEREKKGLNLPHKNPEELFSEGKKKYSFLIKRNNGEKDRYKERLAYYHNKNFEKKWRDHDKRLKEHHVKKISSNVQSEDELMFPKI